MTILCRLLPYCGIRKNDARYDLMIFDLLILYWPEHSELFFQTSECLYGCAQIFCTQMWFVQQKFGQKKPIDASTYPESFCVSYFVMMLFKISFAYAKLYILSLLQK